MNDVRLIERWLPIAEIGEESVRERRSMTALPPTYYLHVWWARRPLVASRAAVLASLLPADADRDRFVHVLGIHGDPVASRRRIDAARRKGERFEGQAYSYPRAFSHVPDDEARRWLMEAVGRQLAELVVLDPTAGGGSIPFEASRLGLEALANDLNPVAALIMRATAQWPCDHGHDLKQEFQHLAARFVEIREGRLAPWFPSEPKKNAISTNYLWARTIACPYCDGRVPLSPNWRLAPGGTGVRLAPRLGGGPGSEGRVCAFEVVDSAAEQSPGTVSRGAGDCPWPDCGRIIDGDAIKAQAQAGRMGEQLYAVVYKERIEVRTKTGRVREKWVRGYRAPRPEDDNGAEVRARLGEKLPEWEAFDLVPGERFPETSNDDRPIQYGMPLWRDLFSPRQLLCHGTSVEVFREMLDADRDAGRLDEARKAAYGYLALSFDKLRDYNSRMTRWHVNREVMVNTFDRHDFSFKWSYAEMSPLITGLGYDWAIGQTAKCIAELVALVRPDAPTGGGDLFDGVDRTGRAAGAERAEPPGATPPAPAAADSIRRAHHDSHSGPIGHAVRADDNDSIRHAGPSHRADHVEPTGPTGDGARTIRADPGGHGDDGEASRRSVPASGSPMAAPPAEQNEATKPDLPPPGRGGQPEAAMQDLPPPPVTITCKPGDSLDHVGDGSIDAVVMDPPYYDNVMYAELSDFFYVWLKRTAGRVFPELFRRQLTDKENEAVANPAKYRGEKGARALAGQDYQERMAAIFGECRRVLKPDGIMTLMFTHKATGAWDALTKGLMESGFVITASWPINTEAEGSLHIKDKAAANSTIFLVCRPRTGDRSGGTGPGEPSQAGLENAGRASGRITPAGVLRDRGGRSGAERDRGAARVPLQVREEPGTYGPAGDAGSASGRIAPAYGPRDRGGRSGAERDRGAARVPLQVREEPGTYGYAPAQDAPALYWEDVEPRVARAVRARVGEFQDAGIAGVDLFLASFGPALEEFSRHWPLKRGTPRDPPVERRRRQQQVLFDEAWDPYATTPEDALDAARREVQSWRLEQLTHRKANADLDPATAFFVLAWDAFKAPVFAYDEALRLARAVGVDLDGEVVGRLAEKKGSDVRLWDSVRRAAAGALGPPDGSRAMIDAVHHAANTARLRSLAAARELLERGRAAEDPRFFAALEAVLEVLPVSRTWTGIDLEGEKAAAGDDFEALWNLARLAWRDRIDEPEQLGFWLQQKDA